MSREVRLLRTLASEIPQFRETFKTHVTDFGNVFPYALMEEFAHFTLETLRRKAACGPDAAQWVGSLKTGLRHLESAYTAQDPELKKLIDEAFIKHLWKAGENLDALKELMGPALKAAVFAAR